MNEPHNYTVSTDGTPPVTNPASPKPPKKVKKTQSWNVMLTDMKNQLENRAWNGKEDLTKGIKRQLERFETLANDWTTCKCGEVDHVLMIRSDVDGDLCEPWDDTLKRLGMFFSDHFRKALFAATVEFAYEHICDAISTLESIEMRATILYRRIERGVLVPPNNNAGRKMDEESDEELKLKP